MRILHALSQTELTGSEVYAWELAQYQVQQGHRLFSISDNFHKNFPGIKINMPLATKSFWQRMKNIFRLRRLLVQEQIDIVHCHSRGACRNLYWASRGLRIPVITTVHGLQHSSWSKRTFDIFGDYVIAVCEKMRDQQIEKFDRDPGSIEVLRNPIEKRFPRPREDQSRLNILLMGRNSGPKGENLKRLLQKHAGQWIQQAPDVQISVVLSGLKSRDISILQRMFPPQIRFQGSVADAMTEMQNADLVIGAGRVAVEALMFGKSVIGLGESEAFGMITRENWSQGLKNNFGDVGEPQVSEDSLEKLSDQVIAFLTSGLRPKIDREFLDQEFSTTRINERVLEIYRAERIRKRIGWLPILMYHKVVNDDRDGQHRIFIHQENFRKHIKSLRDRGFQFLSFKDLSDYWHERRPLETMAKNTVILTFDDGYKNNLEFALPVLKEFQAKATIFLLADHTVLSNSWDQGAQETPDVLMNLQEKKKLDPAVIEVGSHGLRHERLPEKSDQDILSELRVSKTILEHDLERPVPVFAYAFGDIDARLPELARQAGYEFAVNTDRGPVEWTRHPRSLFRVSMFPEDTPWSLRKKTAKWYRQYYHWKRGL